MQIHMSPPNQQQQYVTQQNQTMNKSSSLQQPTTSPSSGYFTDNGGMTVIRNQGIRLPTVPVPTTSMFSSMTPVISQSASQNYLFTSLPQHSTQPNFDVSMLQTKAINNGQNLSGNR